MTAQTDLLFNRVKFRGMVGPEALVAAVIAKGLDDAIAGDPEARAYFALPEYQAHLFWLGLDTSWLPAAFDGNNNGPI